MKIFSNLYQKLKRKIQNCNISNNSVEADYYNGSENDLENILLEIQKLVNPRICPCKLGFTRERINFLVSEGLQVVNFYDKPVSAKVDEEELEKFFNKKIKPKKKSTKKSNGRKRR
jgi:hypothetical protein